MESLKLLMIVSDSANTKQNIKVNVIEIPVR